jgi:hypothetical protein
MTMRVVRALAHGVLIVTWAASLPAQAQTPVTGHYPPGQSGIRGASTPGPGWVFTNFNRLFTNLEVTNREGRPVEDLDELRYGNISMITWTTPVRVFGMTYGALAGIPFATGNLRPSAGDTASSGFGLGDVLVTPVSLYGRTESVDYQVQFTVWTASGRYSPGATDNRGTGFPALVYSVGGVYYPGARREAWSLSAVARIEQNFEQRGSAVVPGDDVVVDWGVGRVLRIGRVPVDAGVSGFGTWQLTSQQGGTTAPDTGRYRFLGLGPEASLPLTGGLTLRVRAQWEFAAHNVVKGNNLWILVSQRW